jgi:serine/threonine protein kinase
MSFLTKLFGRKLRDKGKDDANRVVAAKSRPEPKSTGTTLREAADASMPVKKVEKEKAQEKPSALEIKDTGTTLRPMEPKEIITPLTKEKEAPELSALEMAKRRDWEVKTLPVWEPGDVILDTYEVEDVISGGMGHVYIANHKNWNVKLAIKSPNEMMLSDRDFFARILREANSWTELGLHPNIAYCYYVRNIEDIPHIVVEYVDGGNLRQWIQDGKCIDYRTNLDLAIQFCHGMEYAHAKGMIHRDIKPENVLMTKDGVLKITDFGLVRERRSGGGDQVSEVGSNEGTRKPVERGLTTVGTLMGTEGYMAPEQAESAGDVDERADIFSSGVCLYEMFCGNKPYGITYGEKQDAPDPVELSGDDQFPSDIAAVLLKCAQWEPKHRYSSFKEIRQELSKTYKRLFDEESLYAELEILDIEADGLNNQGVSYFELGNKENALSCWEKALEINATHIGTTYNLSLLEWRGGKIYDSEILRRLDNCEGNPSADKEELAALKAYIHAERFDLDAAKDVLKVYPGRYEALFSGCSIGQISLINSIKGHTAAVRSVAITPDGRYAVSGSDDHTLRVWEFIWNLEFD